MLPFTARQLGDSTGIAAFLQPKFNFNSSMPDHARRRAYIPMKDQTLIAVREFLETFEEVFGTDWQYTKSMLGIQDQTPEQTDAVRKMGLETIHIIASDGTFLEPRVDDETEDWGRRGALLERYRRLKSLTGQSDAPTTQ
ncbi:MAG: hypothetical protein WDN28_23600 [Chthoniobacter sp.]